MNRKVFVCLPWGMDAERYRQRYLEGLEPDASPYGFHSAIRFGFDISFSRDHARKRKARLRDLLSRALLFDITHVWRNRERIRGADVVWTMLEGEGFALAFLMRLHLIARRPLIVNCVWAFDRWDRMLPIRRPFFRWLVEPITRLTVHSDGCLGISAHALPGHPVERMYFGINSEVFAPVAPLSEANARPLRLLAIGSDNTRDWKTFFSAFGNDERFEGRIVCQWVTADDVAPFNNIERIVGPSRAAFRQLYEDADFVVVPMKANAFSGITVALEAAAVGRPVVSSNTGGVPTYFNDDEVLYVPVGDADALREAVVATSFAKRADLVNRAAARFRHDDYSTAGLMQRYADLTCRMLDERGPPGARPVETVTGRR